MLLTLPLLALPVLLTSLHRAIPPESAHEREVALTHQVARDLLDAHEVVLTHQADRELLDAHDFAHSATLNTVDVLGEGSLQYCAVVRDGEYRQHLVRRGSADDFPVFRIVTRRAVLGKAGFTYEHSLVYADSPYIVTEEITARRLTPDVTMNGTGYVRIRSRLDPSAEDYRECDLYELSPDGKHAVSARITNSGATSYSFGIFTREGNAWVEEPTAPSFGTRWCELDYQVTDEGVLGLVIDKELQLVIPVLLPYEGASEECVWVCSWMDSRDTPLVEAAREGQVEVVRALLTSPKVDPGAVDCRGDDATMVTDNPEIIGMVREAQGTSYDRLAALNRAIAYWRDAHEEKFDSGDNGNPISYINTLNECKAAHLEALPQPPLERSPDGRHAVCARVVRGATGQTSYVFTLHTRQGEAWEQEAQQPAISSAVCTPGYRLTDEGIECLFADADMGHLITLLIPYHGEQSVEHHYRAEPFLHPTPLVEAAERGDATLVRALLASDRTDPGAVDCYGRDATMVTEDAELIAMVRAAQGPNYNRRAALEAALHLWQQVAEGKRPAPCRRAAEAALEDICRALSSLPE